MTSVTGPLEITVTIAGGSKVVPALVQIGAAIVAVGSAIIAVPNAPMNIRTLRALSAIVSPNKK